MADARKPSTPCGATIPAEEDQATMEHLQKAFVEGTPAFDSVPPAAARSNIIPTWRR